MAELLLELLSEEIPARMQARAAEDLKRLVTERLREAGLEFETARSFVTPRRLCLVVDGLPEKQPDVREEKKGPRVGAPEKAIQGFLKANGLSSLDQCEKRRVGKAEFWYAVIERRGEPTSVVVGDTLPLRILNFPWPKSMRWGPHDFRWVRPLRNVLAVFDGKPLNFSFALSSVQRPPSGEIEFNDRTFGHRFLAPKPFKVKDFADYRAKLGKARVMLDPAERREAIWKKASELARAEGLTVKRDDALLAEVAGLVEWPVALIGSIDKDFMELPPEVLTTVMRQNQKYFSLLKKDGSLAPRFIVVADTAPDDGGKAIVAGNERVLRARLADARFFWDQDRKMKLEDRVPALDEIIFHAKLGSVAAKVDRMETLAAELTRFITGADKDRARNAARLCKADLVTGMVTEFPELQGIMGRYYALADGETPEVADAIAEHYSPLGPKDECPTAPVSVAVALADKIDTLVGFFAIGEKPTGSKDPFALRRAALGVIRLVLENRLRLSLRSVFETALRGYGLPYGGIEAQALDQLLVFVADRLEVHLREQGLRHDLVRALFSRGGDDDIWRLVQKADALKEFLETESGADLLIAYRRAANIVRIEEKKDDRVYMGGVVKDRFIQDEEKILWAELGEVEQLNQPGLEMAQFDEVLRALATLREPVDHFFDKVTVNCEDRERRENRLRLLSEIRDCLDRVADFSQIEG